MSLQTYRQKRDFSQTPEPQGAKPSGEGHLFVVQKHAAGRLHYDFRLELDGVLKSWAVPKGPSIDPGVKSLAVQVEDHPLEYGSFEGIIPPDEYGGGTVMVWDRGTWTCEGDPRTSFERGKLKFRLDGQRLKGRWVLFRIGGKQKGDSAQNWLLKKIADEHAQPGSKFGLLRKHTTSVTSNRDMKSIASDRDRAVSKGGNGKPKQRGSKAKKKSSQADRSQSKPSAPRNTRAEARTAGEGRPPSRDGVDQVASLPGARKRPLPTRFQPQLATLVHEAPDGDEWLHELKLDGYRMLTRIDARGNVRMLTRRGNDWTKLFPTLHDLLHKLNLKSTILDGEIVLRQPDGTTDFQALQNAIHAKRQRNLVYYLFDIPFCGGYDLTGVELIRRKELLARLLAPLDPNGPLRYSDHIVGRGREVARNACEHGVEGIISKRIDSLYEPRRSAHWVKFKCIRRQEFVIGGWTDPQGARSDFGALLLGYYQDDQLIYCGRVGTGFTRESLQQIKSQLAKLATPRSPFARSPRGRGIHWVKPRLIAEVEFRGWTDDGILRQASFAGLREDKEPQQVTREEPAKPAIDGDSGVSAAQHEIVAGVRLTNPSRVLFQEQGLTKLDLARYYDAVADHLLPHVIDRPLTVVRCPQGESGKCFFQKHFQENLPEAIEGIDVGEGSESEVYLSIKDRAGLISLTQLGVLEIHCWGSRRDQLERPDVMVFDLDPDDAVAWESMVTAARQLRDRLAKLALTSFLRTTGGKGLHVVVPLEPIAEWDAVKQLAKNVADAMVAEQPQLYIATASKAKRRGKIFIDYLRNARGATAIANYSTRARAGAPVATPIRWDELTRKLSPQKYHVNNIQQRLRSLAADPWDGYFTIKQRLPQLEAVRL